MGQLLSTLVLLVAAVAFVGCDTDSPTDTDPGTDTLYTQQEIDYFLEIALGAEFGGNTPRIRKWTSDVKINVQGDPTEADLATLQQVIDELNTLIGGVELRLDTAAPNVQVHVAPEREFSGIEPNYVPVNLGFFWANWNGSSEIFRARILISTERVTQQERSHLIREELTQSLGLMRDSNRYPQSIFFQQWTDVTRYTDLDKTVIEILYRSEIRPNMTRSQVLSVLTSLEG